MNILKIAIPLVALTAIGFASTTSTGHAVSHQALASVICGNEKDYVRIMVSDHVIPEDYTAKDVWDGTVGKTELDKEQAQLREVHALAAARLKDDACQRYTVAVLIDEHQQRLNGAYRALN